MKNFIFKSTDADLQKIVQSLMKDVTIMSNNITYMSYRIDAILKTVTKLDVDSGLQKQVTSYFDDKSDYEEECTEGQDPELKKDLD